MEQRSLADLVAATKPRRWLLFRRPLAERRQALDELAERAAGDAYAAGAVSLTWRALLREGNGTLLTELASQVGRHRFASMVDDLVASFSLDVIGEDHEHVREAVVAALVAIGPLAASRLIRETLSSNATSAAWSLLGLRWIGLGRLMGELASWSRQAEPEERGRLAERLASVSDQSWQDLVEGLAAGLRGTAEERAFAEQILARLDRGRLEKECSRLWLAQRFKPARTLLVQVFDYAQEALP